ncbi:MAG: malonyl-[acyl-carrier protein] O-methyltransferase BioC [Beggiatoa sp. IS2]|nr:MAG: malonyl-[acyl-carrier protein] O-methyltransferase BioC [Beggiatoa sp. IS2]
MKLPPPEYQRKIANAFNRVATDYETHAQLQQEIGEVLLERLQWLKLQPTQILDVGTGTGRLARALTVRYPTAHIYAIDIALQMVKQAQKELQIQQYVICGDATQLPIVDHSIDLIVSNLMLQWCPHPQVVFAEFARVLKPQGALFFSTFGPDTLKELRQSWAQVDDKNHVNDFMEMHDLGDALLQVGLSDPVVDVERFENFYQTVQSLMRYLKNLGAHSVIAGSPTGLMGKNKFKALLSAYETYRIPDQGLPVTFEIIYGYALGSRNRSGRVGETPISLSQRDRRNS